MAVFAEGLQALLKEPGLGSYILVLANASFDQTIYERLQPSLQQRFQQLAEHCRLGLSRGEALAGSQDDQLVFLKLMAIGFEGVRATSFRRQGPWELQFNHLRAFRPSRMTDEVVTGLSRPFDQQGFHFNKPFLRRERLWIGELLGEGVDLFYNKFPFAPLHGLLVPNRQAHLPQLLTRRYHEFIWSLSETLGKDLPGLGLGYNSYGAFASVNHLHFQTFVRQEPLPIAANCWRHNGGNRAYPLACEVYTTADAAWSRIEDLHGSKTRYNLIYLPGQLYCVPRRAQGSYTHAPWTSGFAWYEVAGGYTTFSHEDFDSLDDQAIEVELGKLSLTGGIGFQSPSSHSSR